MNINVTERIFYSKTHEYLEVGTGSKFDGLQGGEENVGDET
jgi:hypothetical protein